MCIRDSYKLIRAVDLLGYLFIGVLKKAYVRPCVAADEVAVVMHGLDYLRADVYKRQRISRTEDARATMRSCL